MSLGRLLGALAAELTPHAPDLAKVIEGWQTLPTAMRAGIVAIVEQVHGKEGQQ